MHLEAGAWQLGLHFQRAAFGEEIALWIADMSVCSGGSGGPGQGKEIPECQIKYRKKNVDSARKTIHWREA